MVMPYLRQCGHQAGWRPLSGAVAKNGGGFTTSAYKLRGKVASYQLRFIRAELANLPGEG